MTNKKLTKRDHFNALLTIGEVKSNPELVKFIENELDLLARKNSSKNGVPTATQKENEILKGLILEEMTANPNKLYSATDLMKFLQNTSNSYPEISNQKVSALLRQMGENGTNEVKKIVDKRKSYFQINQ